MFSYKYYICITSFYFRTKDSSWVFGSLDHSIPEALKYATDHGQEIQLVVHAVILIILNPLYYQMFFLFRLTDREPSFGIVQMLKLLEILQGNMVSGGSI